jgi:hypothetical protein
MLSNISKFSWAELFSNDSGKTSGTAFCGIIICLVGSLCFLLGCIDKMWISHSIDIITQSIVFVGIGATLMGVRKVVGQKSNDSTQKTETTTEQPVEQIKS